MSVISSVLYMTFNFEISIAHYITIFCFNCSQSSLYIPTPVYNSYNTSMRFCKHDAQGSSSKVEHLQIRYKPNGCVTTALFYGA